MDNFCAAGAGRAMLPRMSFKDLPKDWPARPLDDVSVGASVVDLCVSDRDRGVGGLSVLLCRTDRTLSQPVFVEEVPGSELCEVVAGSSAVRALGSRHSFSDLTDTSGTLVDLSGLPDGIRVDPEAATVSVSGGVRYGDLAVALDAERSQWASVGFQLAL